jgi:hypothetical protein
MQSNAYTSRNFVITFTPTLSFTLTELENGTLSITYFSDVTETHKLSIVLNGDWGTGIIETYSEEMTIYPGNFERAEL